MKACDELDLFGIGAVLFSNLLCAGTHRKCYLFVAAT